jgi:hypothetical protein
MGRELVRERKGEEGEGGVRHVGQVFFIHILCCESSAVGSWVRIKAGIGRGSVKVGEGTGLGGGTGLFFDVEVGIPGDRIDVVKKRQDSNIDVQVSQDMGFKFRASSTSHAHVDPEA